jgi:hypothetical protein
MRYARRNFMMTVSLKGGAITNLLQAPSLSGHCGAALRRFSDSSSVADRQTRRAAIFK